ncbi:MAG: hypothetical protein ACI9D5_002372 [Candidatus Endobugula sp.]|jgi:hypothetical protein
MNNHRVMSLNLAKNIFQDCLLNPHNKITTKKNSSLKWLKTVANLDGKRIVKEA